jgi:hypothetical protein
LGVSGGATAAVGKWKVSALRARPAIGFVGKKSRLNPHPTIVMVAVIGITDIHTIQTFYIANIGMVILTTTDYNINHSIPPIPYDNRIL